MFCRDIATISFCGFASIIAICSIITFNPTTVLAEPLAIPKGVTIDAPEQLIPQPGQQSPVINSWRNAENTISVTVLSISSSQENALAAAKELQDWPAVGRTLVDSFGSSYIKTLENVFKAACSFVGAPKARDIERMAVQAELDVTCKTSPNQYVTRARIMEVLTLGSTVIIRVDSEPSADARAQIIAAKIWGSIRVSADQKITLQHQEGNEESTLNVKPITRGRGIKVRDYGLIKVEALIGEYIGAVLGGLLFGIILAQLFMRLKVPPISSLLAGQVLVTALRVFGAEKNGIWEIDPILYFVTGAISVIALKKWAQNKWTKLSSSRRGATKQSENRAC